jgi:anti-sigma factor RsiW
MSGPTEPGPRHVGGLWCAEVMERLPDYLEGELSEPDRAAVDAHLRGCDWCAHFGGEYAHVVESLRGTLGPAPTDSEVAERLAARLAKELE